MTTTLACASESGRQRMKGAAMGALFLVATCDVHRRLLRVGVVGGHSHMRAGLLQAGPCRGRMPLSLVCSRMTWRSVRAEPGRLSTTLGLIRRYLHAGVFNRRRGAIDMLNDRGRRVRRGRYLSARRAAGTQHDRQSNRTNAHETPCSHSTGRMAAGCHSNVSALSQKGDIGFRGAAVQAPPSDVPAEQRLPGKLSPGSV